ncbi:MAG: hypothetical protein IPM79_28130 [Polyangiaceae bacterium]|nr:hypothetical protein [Polyangiaceae bacterium]
MTPKTGEDLFRRMGNMAPSKSTLDRLPKELAERVNDDRASFEAELRDAMIVPEHATTVMVSLDGVLAPMNDGGAVEKKAKTAARGQITKGPAGYREVGLRDAVLLRPRRRLPRRRANGPHAGAAQGKPEEVAARGTEVRARPASDLRVVKAADGAIDNWTFLHNEVPDGVEVVDFFHAAEHLNDAIAAALRRRHGGEPAQVRGPAPRAARRPGGSDEGHSRADLLRNKHPGKTDVAKNWPTSASAATACDTPSCASRVCRSAPASRRLHARRSSPSG